MDLVPAAPMPAPSPVPARYASACGTTGQSRKLVPPSTESGPTAVVCAANSPTASSTATVTAAPDSTSASRQPCPPAVPSPAHAHAWSPTSYLLYPALQQPSYAQQSNADCPSLSSPDACAAAVASAALLTPAVAALVVAAEAVPAAHSVTAPAFADVLSRVKASAAPSTHARVKRLRGRLAAVALSSSATRSPAPLRLLLQAGDCAERFADCADPLALRRKMRLLRRLALVLRARATVSGVADGEAEGAKVVIVGRIAGQFAKPRSCPVEPSPAHGHSHGQAQSGAELRALAGPGDDAGDSSDCESDGGASEESEAEAGCYGCVSPTAPLFAAGPLPSSAPLSSTGPVPAASGPAVPAATQLAGAPTPVPDPSHSPSLLIPVFRGESINAFPASPRARAHDPLRLLQAHTLAAKAGEFVRTEKRGHGLLPRPRHLQGEGNDDSEIGEWKWGKGGAEVLARVTALAASDAEARVRARARARARTQHPDAGEAEDEDEDEVFTSHEGLVLGYEAACIEDAPCADAPALTAEGPACLSADMIWIGERTRAPGQAHIELFRGVSNSLGVKLGPRASPAELSAVLAALDPAREPGRVTVITRLGAGRAETAIPPLVAAVAEGGHRVVWACDPMHGNTRATAEGVKTRDYDNIVAELKETARALHAAGVRLGGVHLEVSAERVAECVGGPGGAEERGLRKRYTSQCDPRLNEPQALQAVWELADTLSELHG